MFLPCASGSAESWRLQNITQGEYFRALRHVSSVLLNRLALLKMLFSCLSAVSFQN